MKRLLGSFAFLAALALSACGPSTTTTTQVASPTPAPPTAAPPVPPSAAAAAHSGTGDTSDNPDASYACAFQGNGAYVTVAGPTKAGTDVFCSVFPNEVGFSAISSVTIPSQSSCYSTLASRAATLRFYQAPDGTNAQLNAICSALLGPTASPTPASAGGGSGGVNPQGATLALAPSHASPGGAVHFTFTGLTPNQNGKVVLCYEDAADHTAACTSSVDAGNYLNTKSFPTSDAAGNLAFDWAPGVAAGSFAAATPSGDHVAL